MPTQGTDATFARTLANDWLKAFALALRNVGLYSPEHPRARVCIEVAYESLRRLIGRRREVVLSRSEGRLFLDGTPLDRDRGLAHQLAHDLSARGVDTIVFESTLTPEDHVGLLRCLLLSPDRLHEIGGLRQLLSDEGIRSVRANADVPGRVWDAGGTVGLEDVMLLEILARLDGEPAGAGASGVSTAGSVLARAPVGLARAIAAVARERAGGATAEPGTIAHVLAITLERIAERAVREGERDRGEIVRDVGRAVVGSDPDVHPSLFLEQAAAGSGHEILEEAVETLPPTDLGELVAIHYPRARGGGDYGTLSDILGRTAAWQAQRAAAVSAVERRLRALDVRPEEIGELVDRLLWNELDSGRRLELLYKDNSLWSMDFSRTKRVLEELLGSGPAEEPGRLLRKYLSGLMAPDPAARRRVAGDLGRLIEVLGKSEKGRGMLGWVADVLLARLHDEKDDAVAEPISAALTLILELRLGAGEPGAALELILKGERLLSAASSKTRERGEKLSHAVGRCGDERSVGSLLELALDGSPQESSVAAEILRRSRVGYVLERLAEEEDRSRRARLVGLLKKMARTALDPFIPYLLDSRWYVVRNVVAILGSSASPAVLPELEAVRSHADPRVRREVVRALLHLGTPECEDRLVAFLADPDSRVRIAAINALVTLKSLRAFPPLAALSRAAHPFEGVSPDVREEALTALGKLGRGDAFEILAEIVSRKGLLGHAEPTELRAAAAKALSLLGTPDARALLEQLAEGDPRTAVREAARQGLRSETPSRS